MHQKLFKSYPSCWLINCEADTDDDIISAHVKGQSCYLSLAESLCFMLRHRWRPIEQSFMHFLQKHNLAEVFLMHASCKTIFCVQIDVINIIFPCFLFRSDAKRDGHCAAVCFSWLNFSSEIRLYHTYFPNYFKFSAATISAISSSNFTHMQPTRTKIFFFNSFYFQ